MQTIFLLLKLAFVLSLRQAQYDKTKSSNNFSIRAKKETKGMKINILMLILFLKTLWVSAQTKGIVVDDNNLPIPYVNIWVEGENIGTTSQEDGTFVIDSNDSSKNLIFSILGFDKKTIKLSEAKKVVLQAQTNELKEVVIQNRKNTKEIEIGKSKNTRSQAFDNGPKIDVKYFPYKATYKTTKFIKKVAITTDNLLEEATFKLHFYSVDENGFPGKEFLQKDFLVTVKKGILKTIVDVSQFNLTMPKNGLFVGFEKLLIDQNKFEKKRKDLNSNAEIIQKMYYPFMLYKIEERDFAFTFFGGKWHKTGESNVKKSTKITIFEPAINLILSN